MIRQQQQPGTDIGQVLDHGRWGAYQKLVLVLVASAIVLDGFDNQVLGFAVPVLVKEWGLDRAAFGPVFGLGFLGMSVGTMLGGWAGDRIGRRLALIFSVVLFGAGTALTAFTDGIVSLGLCRVAAGLGLGGAMPTAAALIAEFTPAARRGLAVTLGIVCIPLGGVLGGFIAAEVLPTTGWRMLFGIAGLLPLLVAGLLLLLLPESPRFLLRKGQTVAAAKIMARITGEQVSLPLRDTGDSSPVGRGSVRMLLAPGLRVDTLALWLAFFACLLSTYLVFSWAPTYLSQSGFSLVVSSQGLAVFNIGGVLGAIATAIWIAQAGSRRALVSLAVLAAAGAALLALFPLAPAKPAAAFIALFLEGGLINGVQTGLYVLAAQLYPLPIRGSGVGAASGVGRLGAIVSSFVGVAVVGSGAFAYFGTITIALGVALFALATMRRHVPPVASVTGQVEGAAAYG